METTLTSTELTYLLNASSFKYDDFKNRGLDTLAKIQLGISEKLIKMIEKAEELEKSLG